MCAILLSINPEHVDIILCGEKIYEYRKLKCRLNIEKIYIYSTSPVMKVVGEAGVETILEGSPKEIWNKTRKKSGINKTFFDKYYKNKKQAVAYKLCNVVEYERPMNLGDFGIKSAPQSFQYINN